MRLRTFRRFMIAVGVAALGLSRLESAEVYRVTVGADGRFSPASLNIRVGDTVEWQLPSPSTAIVVAAGPPVVGACPVPRPFASGDTANFTGPMPLAPGGIFVMSPLERGFRVQSGSTCAAGPVMATAGGDVLCATGQPFATLDSTWDDPNATGVFIRLYWNRVQVAPGLDDASFDFRELDRELDKAVASGKVYSLGIKAGEDGTPDWIFSTPPAPATPRGGARGAAGRGRGAAARGRAGTAAPVSPAPPTADRAAGGVTRLTLQDSLGEGQGCGQPMDLGSPTDPMFEKHYFDMLTKVARHIRSRSDWYRSLAYIKPSGANLVSHENRIPTSCNPGCICNPQVLADAGYRPQKLYDFYRRQFDLLAREFPGKAMAYALIQDGFPMINDAGEVATGRGRGIGASFPRGAEQTETILEIGERDHRTRFVVQHNGLQQAPPARTCPNEGRHPARPPYSAVGTGCPNRWVLQAGADGDRVTGFQIVNARGVSNPAELDSSLRNAWVNSDGSFVEIYEERFWEATHTTRGVLPGGKTLADWANDFHGRRRGFRAMPDPFPSVHRHTFRDVQPQTLHYYDPTACARGVVATGTIVVAR